MYLLFSFYMCDCGVCKYLHVCHVLCVCLVSSGVRSPAPVVNGHLGAGNQTWGSWGEQSAPFITEASV